MRKAKEKPPEGENERSEGKKERTEGSVEIDLRTHASGIEAIRRVTFDQGARSLS